MNIAVILAGGVGNRVGAGIPKQFIEVLGKPVLAYTIEPFEKHSDVDAILVVCVKPYIDYIWELKEKYGFSKLRWVTEGGSTFQESMINGMNYLKDKADQNDTVLFHFGASPFITADIIEDAIKVCQKNGSNAISTTDYILLSGKKKLTTSVSDPENYTDEYIDRDTVAVMNGPHAFRYGFLVDMYREAMETGVIDTVEPHTTTLMYALGKRIYFSKGSQGNLKITTKDDLSMFEGYVLEQQRNTKEKTKGDVILFLADGFEECEALIVVDLLRRAGISTVMASVTGKMDVRSSREILVRADCLAENADYDNAEMLVLPGGRAGCENLRSSELVRETCIRFAGDKKLAAVCAAPSILTEMGLLNGKKAACHPDYENRMEGAVISHERVAVSGNIITSRGLGTSFDFGFAIINALGKTDMIRKIKDGICF